jgi:hypothetical protein
MASMPACLTAALAAGGLSLANAAIGFAEVNSDDPQSVSDYLAVLLFSAALVAAAVASAFLRRLGADRPRRAWGVGLAVAVAGGTLAGAGNLVEDAFGVSAFGLLFALGGLALVIGLLTAGGSVLATAPPWRWVGVALVLVAIGIAVGEQAGFALVGLTWIALAFLLGGRTSHFRLA